MKSIIISITLLLLSLSAAYSQTLAEAKDLYNKGEYAKALPVFEKEYTAKPTDAYLSHWYGVCLYETKGDIAKAEQCLLDASKKNIQNSFYYLALLYTDQFRFEEASANFDKYETLLKKKKPGKKKEDIESHEADLSRLEEKKKNMSRLNRVVSNTEDIQIIDSVVVDKVAFLSSYKLSTSGGKLDYFNAVFSANRAVASTVYFNEKETKIYYGQPDKDGIFSLFSMEKLLDEYGNERKLSATNFGLSGNLNYPFVMSDGVTIYFAAKDEESLGGYDLFVSRYNMNNDTYLTPERLNMPFNSQYNDYMMVVDEEKGVGWFASDRFQPEGKVCVYTFIPNKSVKAVESEDEMYMASRALISSIKQSWVEGKNYKSLIELARKAPKEEVKVIQDFKFVINDELTYFRLVDFKNTVARDTYHKVVQMKAEQFSLERNLQNMRDTYSTASQDAKRDMTAEILSMEKQLEQFQREIPKLEMQARNQEIQSLK